MDERQTDMPYAKAHQAIGAYFCAFSALEHELGETIKLVLQLQNHEAGDAVMAALRKVGPKPPRSGRARPATR
jgi:hypothetical protein